MGTLSSWNKDICERIYDKSHVFFGFWSDEQDLASSPSQSLPSGLKERRLNHQFRLLHCTYTYK